MTREYVRRPAWYLVIVIYLAALGGLRTLLGDVPQIVLFAVVSLAATSALWWFTAWFMLMGQVRWRVLVPSGVVTGVAIAGFAVSAALWMPDVVTRNQSQFGLFGVALALTTWFSGAAICILVGACAGSVLAVDTGWLGTLIRGPEHAVLTDGAEPSFAAPARASAQRGVPASRRRGGFLVAVLDVRSGPTSTRRSARRAGASLQPLLP